MAGQGPGLGDRITILVVEDDERVRDLIRQVLEPTGALLLLAASAEEAMAAAAEGHVDLLLTDVMLPGARGTELATTLRNAQPTLRVIYMTGWRDHIALADVPDAVILNKPFELKELARVVASAFGGDPQA